MREAVARWIRRGRQELGLSQARLGEEVSVSQAMISNWETGKLEPDAKQRRALTAALGPLTDDRGESEEGFGDWLLKAREKRGWTRDALATKAGVSAVQIYNIETGRTLNPQKSTRKKLEKALATEAPAKVVAREREGARIEGGASLGIGDVEPFDPWTDDEWPDASGVYWFLDHYMRLTYVGKGAPISARLKDHRDHKWYVGRVVAHGRYVEIDNRNLRDAVEDLLIKAGGPLINKNQHDHERR